MSLNIENVLSLFPCSKDIDKRNSKLFYEQNIANIVRQVTDCDCYVISGNVTTDGKVDAETLKLSIYGYFLELAPGTPLVTDDTSANIYIGVELTNDANLPTELNGQVVNNELTCIYLSKTAPTDSNIKYFKLLHKIDGKWYIPPQSRVKFNLSSIFEIEDIDGIHDIGTEQ